MAKAKAKGDANESAGSTPRSGMEAVRWAVDELGYDAATQKVYDHIVEKWGMELNKNKISAYKSKIRSDAGLTKPRGSHSGGRRAAPPVAPIELEDIQRVKELVGRLGADRVR